MKKLLCLLCFCLIAISSFRVNAIGLLYKEGIVKDLDGNPRIEYEGEVVESGNSFVRDSFLVAGDCLGLTFSVVAMISSFLSYRRSEGRKSKVSFVCSVMGSLLIMSVCVFGLYLVLFL